MFNFRSMCNFPWGESRRKCISKTSLLTSSSWIRCVKIGDILYVAQHSSRMGPMPNHLDEALYYVRLCFFFNLRKRTAWARSLIFTHQRGLLCSLCTPDLGMRRKKSAPGAKKLAFLLVALKRIKFRLLWERMRHGCATFHSVILSVA